jgi:cobalt-zinc-cadmium efflux system membrane fusion protein
MSRITLLSLLTFFVLSQMGCREAEKEEVPAFADQMARLTITKKQFESGNMALGTPAERSFPKTVQATGMIDVPPQNKAVVSAFMGGYIKETPLLIGDLVEKGQSLVTLENPEFITLQQNYLEAAQELNFLQADYERQKQLVAENISSQKNFLKAESDYRGKLALYNALKEKLKMLNFSIANVESGDIRSAVRIFSPISGSITKMNVSRGMYVSPSDEILEITDNDHIHLELNVFEKDILELKREQVIRFSIPEASGESFQGQVYLIGAHIEENRTVKVHAHLKEEDQHRFLTGMFVQAQIVTSEVMKKSLPDESLAEIEGTTYALKLISETPEEYLFEKVRVVPQERYAGFTAIDFPENTEGNASFLTKGAFALLTGEW